MKKVRFIGNKKRTNTPIANRQRPVMYRHQRLDKKTERISRGKNADHIVHIQHTAEPTRQFGEKINEMKSFFMDVGKTSAHSFRNFCTALKEKYNAYQLQRAKRVAADREKQQRLQQERAEIARKQIPTVQSEAIVPAAVEKKKRPTRKQRLIAEADMDISTPKTNRLVRLLLPAYAIDRMARVTDGFMMFIGMAIRNLIHWLVFSFLISSFIAYFINQTPFSIARMNFSDTALMALKFAFLFCIFEVIYLIVFGFIANVKVSYNYRHHLGSLTAIAAGFPTVLYLLAIAVLPKNYGVSIIIGVLGMLASCFLRMQALMKSAPFSTTLQLLVLMVLCTLFIVAGYFFLQLTMHRTFDILKLILNI